ncbi:MAG: type II toxin-antitoxin system RelE/ParE family toxin [Gemmataceae bacterium]
MADLVIRDEARQDIAEGYDWYEGRRAGLGAKFLDRVGECLDSIRVAPLARAVVRGPYRRAVVRKYPYVVYYDVVGDVVTIWAVFQAQQNPRKLWNRLP